MQQSMQEQGWTNVDPLALPGPVPRRPAYQVPSAASLLGSPSGSLCPIAWLLIHQKQIISAVPYAKAVYVFTKVRYFLLQAPALPSHPPPQSSFSTTSEQENKRTKRVTWKTNKQKKGENQGEAGRRQSHSNKRFQLIACKLGCSVMREIHSAGCW